MGGLPPSEWGVPVGCTGSGRPVTHTDQSPQRPRAADPVYNLEQATGSRRPESAPLKP